MRLIDYLKWPTSSVFSITMTKKVLREALEPEKKDDLLASIEKMTWTGSLKPQHAQIPALVNTEFCYNEILCIAVILREKAAADRVARLLQRIIPYPMIIGFEFGNERAFQIAEKLIHKQQPDKRVVNQNKFYFSEWMDAENLTDQQKIYLANLSLDKVGGTNLKEYFDKLMGHVHDENRQDQLALLALEKKATTIKNEYARERNAAKKAELHTQARALADQIKTLKTRLNNN